MLENRADGVYAYCSFNDTENGQKAKKIVEHGDVVALSIFANQLKQDGSRVIHGAIKEVSLVLAGANPGALINSVMAHGEESDAAEIYNGLDYIEFNLEHSDDCDNGILDMDKPEDGEEESSEDVAEETADMQHADDDKSKKAGEVVNVDHDAIGNNALAFVGTSGVQLGWLASQADMLADDWQIVPA